MEESKKIPPMPQVPNVPKPPVVGQPAQIPDIKPPKPRVTVKPHVFVKIDAYRDIMKRIDEIKEGMQKLSQLLNEMINTNKREEQKLFALGQVLNNINQNVEVIDNIFSEPEE